jgi:sugar/nucleoside kinase (ribokinase family)
VVVENPSRYKMLKFVQKNRRRCFYTRFFRQTRYNLPVGSDKAIDMTHAEIYTIGNLTIDDIVFWPDGQNWMGQPGGDALFSAMGARMWSESVGVLARQGCDYPARFVESITAWGLLPVLQPVETPTLHDWALYEANGARQFINHLNSGSNEQATLTPEEIPYQHLRGRAYHIAPAPTQQQTALARRLRAINPGENRAGKPLISLDPHENWIINQREEVYQLVALVDFFLPSEGEACKLYGKNDPERAVREFGRYGPRAVVIKLGREGSLVYDVVHDRLAHVPCYPANTLDPTGAGDAYCGGFLAGYLASADPIQAALYGTVSASYVVEAVGSMNVARPTRADAQARLAALVDKVELLTV